MDVKQVNNSQQGESKMKIHEFTKAIEYWYDRSPRVWYAMIKDGEGHQICDGCPDAYTRQEILEICADMAKDPTPYLDQDHTVDENKNIVKRWN